MTDDRWAGEELLPIARDLIEAAEAAGVTMRLLGGLAFFELSSLAREGPFRRGYHDFDLGVPTRQSGAAARIFRDAGYTEDRQFNALHGARRLIFTADAGFDIDVLVGTFRMCHQIDLERALLAPGLTINPAELLLTKLQIFEIESKDLSDAAALLATSSMDQPDPAAIDLGRFTRPLAADWGFHHTVSRNLVKLEEFSATLGDVSLAATIRTRLEEIAAAIERVPKSIGWRARARIGERVRWYQIPEEVR